MLLLLLAQVIVMSRKPEFFSYNMPLYEVVTPDGLMRPVLAARLGGLYCGGSARQVRWHSGLGCRADAAQHSCWVDRHVPLGTPGLHDEHDRSWCCTDTSIRS
jgi:hypothetical protein